MRDPGLAEENDYSAWDLEGLDDDAAAARDAQPIILSVAREEGGQRLDKWLATRLGQFSRTRLRAWIESGSVEVNGRKAAVRQAVWEGDRIVVKPERTAEESAFVAEPMDLPIVYEDEAVIVIDKPAGLVVHPGAGNWQGTLQNGLLHHAPRLAALPRAGIVHRLDKDTSGLMMVAKTLEAQTSLVRQLQARSVVRRYLAVVHGLTPPDGTIDAPIGRSLRDRKRMAAFKSEAPGTRSAVTHFHTLALRPEAPGASLAVPVSLVSCRLETGRTHQIRVHMQSVGHPLYGDALYGRARAPDPFPRQALHAFALGFVHPGTGRQVGYRSALRSSCRCGSGRRR